MERENYIRVYIYICKKTGGVYPYGSLRLIASDFKININYFYNLFSRKKLKEFENEDFKIIKTKLKR
jgi:hypothetical protein